MKRSYLTKLLSVAVLVGFTILIPVSSSAAQSDSRVTDPPLLKKCWNYPAGPSEAGLAGDISRIFIGEANARIEAVSVDTGAKLWASDLGGTIVSNLFVGDKNLYIATRSVGSEPSRIHTKLWALNKESGLTVFSIEVNNTGQVILSGVGQLVFAISDSLIAAVDSSTGATLWSRPLSSTVSAAPVILNDRIILATSDKVISTIATPSGDVISRVQTKFITTATAPHDANRIIVGDERGNLSSLDTASGRTNWKLRQGARISEIDISGDDMLITSYDNFIYSVSADSGKIAWKKRMPGRVSAVPSSSGNLAVTLSTGENIAFVIDTKNGRSLNQLTLEGENTFVQEPLVTANSAIFATVDGVFSYGINGCPAK
jgi:outer membrane protein assembly factor BamB